MGAYKTANIAGIDDLMGCPVSHLWPEAVHMFKQVFRNSDGAPTYSPKSMGFSDHRVWIDGTRVFADSQEVADKFAQTVLGWYVEDGFRDVLDEFPVLNGHLPCWDGVVYLSKTERHYPIKGLDGSVVQEDQWNTCYDYNRFWDMVESIDMQYEEYAQVEDGTEFCSLVCVRAWYVFINHGSAVALPAYRAVSGERPYRNEKTEELLEDHFASRGIPF